MSGITIDFITLLWGSFLVVIAAATAVNHKSCMALLIAGSVVLYLTAQTGWTSSYFATHEWGRVISNYIWFIFNSSVLLMYTLYLNKVNKHGQIPTEAEDT